VWEKWFGMSETAVENKVGSGVTDLQASAQNCESPFAVGLRNRFFGGRNWKLRPVWIPLRQSMAYWILCYSHPTRRLPDDGRRVVERPSG
jgi:hypothetical protein